MFVLYCMAMFVLHENVWQDSRAGQCSPSFPRCYSYTHCCLKGKGGEEGGREGKREGAIVRRLERRVGRVTDGGGRRLIGCRNALCSL